MKSLQLLIEFPAGLGCPKGIIDILRRVIRSGVEKRVSAISRANRSGLEMRAGAITRAGGSVVCMRANSSYVLGNP